MGAGIFLMHPLNSHRESWIMSLLDCDPGFQMLAGATTLHTVFCIVFHFKTLNIFLMMKKRNNFGVSCWCTIAHYLTSLFLIKTWVSSLDEDLKCLSSFCSHWGLEFIIYKHRYLSFQMNKTFHYLTRRTSYTVTHLSSSVTVSKEQWDVEMSDIKSLNYTPVIFYKREWLSLKHWGR